MLRRFLATILKHFLFATLALSWAISATASGATKSLSDYVKVIWRMEDGLPQNGVKKIVQTRDGYIWVGTEGGVARFDGVRFTVFTTQDTPGLESNNVHDLVEDSEGNLWILANSGLSRYKNGRFDNFTPRDEKNGDRIGKFWIGADGHLMVRSDSSVYRYAGGRLNKIWSFVQRSMQECRLLFRSPDGSAWMTDRHGETLYQFRKGLVIISVALSEPIDMSGFLCTDRSNRLWIGGTSTLLTYASGRITAYRHPEDFHNYPTEQLSKDGHGDCWCISHNTVFQLRGDRWVAVDTIPEITGRAHQLEVDANGDMCLWIAGMNADTLYRYRNGQFDKRLVEEKVAVEWTMPVLQDNEGNVWIGTKSGLECLKDLSCRTFAESDGLPRDAVSTVYQDRSGRMWIGTDDAGLGYLENGKFVRTGVPAFDAGHVQSICQDSTGALWVSTGTRLLRYRNGKVDEPYKLPRPDGWDNLYNVCEDAKGTLWLSEGLDLFRCDRGRLTCYSKKDGFDSKDQVMMLYPDRKGGLWIGALVGCMYYDGKRFTAYGTAQGLPTVPVVSIHEDSDGYVWVGTWGGGLYRIKNGKVVEFTAKDGLYSDSILQILEDSHDNLWIGSARGIFCVPRRQLNAYADRISQAPAAEQPRSPQAITCDPYSSADGASGGQCHGGTQQSCCRARDGSLWFAGINGLVRVGQRKSRAVSAVIEQAIVDKRAFQTPRSLDIEPGRGNIEIDYTALDHVAPQRIQFQYKLEGFDADWVKAGLRRVAYYTNVPPGTYRFVVSARNSDGGWNSTESSFTFTIRPHYYQTNWFRALCVFAIAALALALYRLRVRQLELHNRELEARVAQRTEDLVAANDQLHSMHEEVIAQNDELQEIQAEVESQNQELMNIKAELEEKNSRLEGLATEDGLTGLKNHRVFQEQLEQHWTHSSRYHDPVSIVLMDVDKFKQYNDTFGHPAGDDVLKKVAQILKSCARETDVVARYGGEEFVVILPKTDARGAKALAERFRLSIEQAPWSQRPVTASFGVATLSPLTETRESLIAQADEALYSSKRAGRNTVTHADELKQTLSA